MDQSDRQTKEQQMQKHIETWQTSNLTQKDYCIQNDIPFNTFYYWLKRLRDKEQTLSKGFVSLRIKDYRATAGGSINIHYPNGVQLSVPSTMDIRLMSKLIRLI